jgi:hypothetical protein
MMMMMFLCSNNNYRRLTNYPIIINYTVEYFVSNFSTLNRINVMISLIVLLLAGQSVYSSQSGIQSVDYQNHRFL